MKLVAARAKRVLPYFDPVTVSPTSRDDITEILDGYSSIPHCHRSTHEASFPEITGSGLPVLDAPAPWMPGPQVSTVGTPVAGVVIDATAEWTQALDGDLDVTEIVNDGFREGAALHGKVNTLTPGDLETGWWKAGSDVNGDSGWKVIETKLVQNRDLPVAIYPRDIGPFHASGENYNYVKDPNLKNPVPIDIMFERTWYDAVLKLSWSIRQKRAERVLFTVLNGGQRWAAGEFKRLSIRLEDVSRDDVTPYWRPLQRYKAGTLWKVGTTVYSCLRDHVASRFFEQDKVVTGPQGGIVQQWQETVGDQSPLGFRGNEAYWLLPRGEQTLQSLLFKARAIILHSQRCIEIKFKHLLTDALLDVTTASSVRLHAPSDMLRGSPAGDGVVVAKVYGYEIVSDQEDEYVEITLRACVGAGGAYEGLGGTVTLTGEGWDRITYGNYFGQIPEGLPEIQAGAEVRNKVPEQIAYVHANDYDPKAVPPRADKELNDPVKVIGARITAIDLYLTPIAGRPDMGHDILVPIAGPFTGPRQWSVIP